MNNPSLDVLESKVDNKYTIAILAAKRAREIINGSEPLVDSKSTKPVTMALEEIAQEKITYVRRRSGIK